MPNPYEIDLGPKPPALPGGVVLRETFDDLLDAICADVALQASACVREFGDFQFLVSPTPQAERLLTRLMIDPHYREFPWSKTRVWTADDEPAQTGSRSAGHEQLAGLLTHAGHPEEQLHGFGADPTDGPDGQTGYETLIRETLEWREKGQDRPDFALLSLRQGGGIAGIEPADLDANHSDHLAIQSETGRLSVTMRLLNASRFIAVLAIGQEVEPVLQSIGDPNLHGLMPASRLRPLGGELRWYLDHASCGSPAEDPR